MLLIFNELGAIFVFIVVRWRVAVFATVGSVRHLYVFSLSISRRYEVDLVGFNYQAALYVCIVAIAEGVGHLVLKSVGAYYAVGTAVRTLKKLSASAAVHDCTSADLPLSSTISIRLRLVVQLRGHRVLQVL